MSCVCMLVQYIVCNYSVIIEIGIFYVAPNKRYWSQANLVQLLGREALIMCYI